MVIEHPSRCDAFHQHAEDLKEAMEAKSWKERDEDLRKQLISSVEALLIFKKYPVPNATALSKRIKVGNRLVSDINACALIYSNKDFYTTIEGLLF